MDFETKILTIAILCILITSYLLFKLVYKKVSPFKKIGFWITSIITSGLALLIIPYILFIISFGNPYPSEEFNSNIWKNNEEKRIELIDNLMDKKLLDGLTKNELIELLGEPIEKTGYFKNSGRDMIYYLGAERHPFGVDSKWLLIWLENDIVNKYEVWTD